MNAGSISVIIRVTAGAEIREDGVFDLRPVKSRRLRNTWNSEREIQARRYMMTKQEIKSEVEKMTEDAEAAKSHGEKYCICPACTAGGKLLDHEADLLK